MHKKRKQWLRAVLFCVVALFASVQAQAQMTVAGHVVDENDEPLIGVAIREKNGDEATVSRIDGEFQITVNGTAPQLEFSYIGMKTHVVAIRKDTVGSQRVGFLIIR